MEAIIGAIVGALVGAVGAYLKFTTDVKKIKAEYLAANRKRWINRVIERTVDYIAAIKHAPTDKLAITRLQAELELLLNPAAEDEGIRDKKAELIIELEKAEQVQPGPETDQAAKRILALSKEVLAYEWNAIKQDI